MIDNDVITRIHNIYHSCTTEEQRYLLKILREISETGDSYTYRDIWLADYREIPVDIGTFICDSQFLGKVNRNGDAVYPFWKSTLNEIFSAGNKYQEIFFTGATRIGKSSTAIVGTAYMLYRLMCLKDPQKFFNKKDVSKFSVLFFNITKDLAAGVAFREFNDTLAASPWFMNHGKLSKSEKNFYYIPEGGKIDIDYGSSATHGLGKQVFVGFCVTGDTPVLTSTGYVPIRDLEDRYAQIGQYDGQNIIYNQANIIKTAEVSRTIKIELEDGTCIEGTPDHLVMLSDGSYKKLGDITSSDDLLTFNIKEVDHMNLQDRTRLFTVYKHISPNGKQYVGITSYPVEKRWGNNGKGYADNKHFWNAICKYGWNNFKHEIVAENLSLAAACSLEKAIISEFELMNPDNGYNQTSGGEYAIPSNAVREKLRESTSRNWENPEFRKKVISSLQGHECSDETKRKISASKKGVKLKDVSPLKGRTLSDEHRNKLKGRVSWIKGKTKYNDDRVAKIAEKLKGQKRTDAQRETISEAQKLKYKNGYSPIWITNGEIERSIDASTDSIPPGFWKGRLNTKCIYVYKGQVSKKISEADIELYLTDGWKRGRGAAVGLRISEAVRKYTWTYDNKMFDTATDLAMYLNTHGYPTIVASTITSLYNKGFEHSKKYCSLAGKIERLSHED